MPRSLAIGNGQLLINFDANYCLRDLYYPHVGQENHLVGHKSRLGVWVGNADGSNGQFSWCDDPAWARSLDYEADTMVTSVILKHTGLGLTIHATDAVDFHDPLLVREFVITQTVDSPRQVRLFLHHDFHILENVVGDTAYYEPLRRAVLHYKKDRWFLINGICVGAQQEGVDQWAVGVKEVGGQEGTWRDAEDGVLGGNPIAQGSVDSTVAFHANLPPSGSATIFSWLAVGKNFEDVRQLNHRVREQQIQTYMTRIRSYWSLWLHAKQGSTANLPEEVIRLYKRSLLILRTQIDEDGAIIAANDYDVIAFSSDTYSYMWPRDGALVAHALDMAGHSTIPQRFFEFCARVITPEGYLLHKYNPDGTLASSWHSWYRDGQRELPIQEDETGLVLWSLWAHYERFRDIEWLNPLFRSLIVPAADWMVSYRNAVHLPLPSWDLWEERRGIHAFTVGAVWAGLEAAAKFCNAFGEEALATKYRTAADEIKKGANRHLLCTDPQGRTRFVRMIMRKPDMEGQKDESSSQMVEENTASRVGRSGVVAAEAGNAIPASTPGTADETNPSPNAIPSAAVPATPAPPVAVEIRDDFVIDWTIDSAITGLWSFGMYAPDDPRVVATFNVIRDRLWCKTEVGGMARYENDYYYQVSQDVENVPGNPWFICTLWVAQHIIATAKTLADLAPAVEVLQWVAAHALPSGVLAEQVNPFTHAPLSVAPLTWSHAAVVNTVQEYIEAYARLSVKA